VDPFSLLLLAQSAVGAIRTGCEMLQQGQAVIDEFRGEAESIVGQINEAKEQALGLWEAITGLWDWARGLLGTFSRHPSGAVTTSEPAKPSTEGAAIAALKPVAKKAKQKQRELSYEEYKAKAIHEICEHMKVFFEAQRQLKIHCRELEEESLTTDRVADKAIDRIEIETQLVSLSTQIREAMSWTPEHLGLQDMYKRFLQMHELILEEQEFDRQMKLKDARNKRWRHEARRNFRIDLATWAVAMAVVVSAWWWMMAQVAMLSGMSSGCCSLQ
jgi:hypothetical protein